MQIPDKINQFNVYRGTVTPESKVVGVTDEVTLPTFTNMSETVNLAGMAGEIDSPTVGQLQSAEIEIPFSNISVESLEVVAEDNEPIVFRAAQEFIDSNTRTKVYKNRTVTVIGMTKAVNYGSLKKGGYGNPSVTKEVTYYKDVIDGVTATEVDKINGVYVVGGKNMLEEIDKYI